MARRVVAAAALVAWFVALGPSQAGAQGQIDCPDFIYQEDAQAVLDNDRSDPHGLDADSDGIACEELPRRGAATGRTTATTTQRTPDGMATTGVETNRQVAVAMALVGAGALFVRWARPRPFGMLRFR